MGREQVSEEHAGAPRPLNAKNDDVGLDVARVELDARHFGQGICQPTRPGVVLDEALDVVGQGVAGRGGEDTGLAHGPAEALFPPPCFVDEVLVPGESGSHRRPKSLREIDPNAVEWLHQRRRRLAGDDRGVEQPRPVEVRRQPVGAGYLHDCTDVLPTPDRPAGEVGRLFDPGEARPRRVPGQRRDGRGQLLGAVNAAFAINRAGLGTGQRGRATGFGVQGMGGAVAVELVARPAMEHQRDLVAHRAGR